MLTPSDILHLPYTPDLTDGGIAYALRTLAYGSPTYERMRRMAAGVAVELAFRRHLALQNIPYEIAASLPLTEHARHAVLLDNRRCDIKSFLISYREQISKIRSAPEMLLDVPALVPSDIDAGEGIADKDLYIFAFVTGLQATSQADLKKVIETNQPHYFVHILPEQWRSPAHWNPLGGLILKSESQIGIQVEICGQNAARDFITRLVEIPPQKRILVNDPFYAISALHLKNNPSARLGVVINKHTHIIAPADWKNIWVYGLDILLAGFITRGEFRQRAKHIPPKTRVFQYNSTRVKNLAIPVSALKPLQALFARIK